MPPSPIWVEKRRRLRIEGTRPRFQIDSYLKRALDWIVWRGVAQPGSASALGAEGPQFKSGRPEIDGESIGQPDGVKTIPRHRLPVAQLDRAAAF